MKTVVNTQLMIGDLEVVGDTHLLEQCCGVLSLDWEGNVERVLFRVPSDKGWYETIDKGGIPLYGFNQSGNVICSMVLLTKGTDVIFIAPAKRTDSWGWNIL